MPQRSRRELRRGRGEGLASLVSVDDEEEEEEEQCLIRRGRLKEVRWGRGGGDAERERERARVRMWVYVKDGMVSCHLCRGA